MRKASDSKATPPLDAFVVRTYQLGSLYFFCPSVPRGPPIWISDFSGENPAEYLSFTMVISVSPRYPSHYLYSFHTCAYDLCP